VTSLSFVLGHQFWGTNPGAEHLVNVAIHALSAALLFLVLQRMTRVPMAERGGGRVVAWHPLRVESVAWIAERKDVLSVFFFFLTLLAYARYAQGRSSVQSRAPSAGRDSLALDARLWTLDYCLVLVFFALGLMSKAMLVTVPFVLLLLDIWPLRRVTCGRWQVTNEKKAGAAQL